MAHLAAVRDMFDPPALMHTRSAAAGLMPPASTDEPLHTRGALGPTSPAPPQLGVLQQLMHSAQKKGHAVGVPGTGPGWLLDSLFAAHESHPHHPPTLARRLDASREEASQLGRQLNETERKMAAIVRDDKALMHQLQSVARRISNSSLASVSNWKHAKQLWW